MQVVDFTCAKPAENIALDEALLDEAEENDGPEVLRFWESPGFFVVIGSSNRVSAEVNLDACKADGVPVLRRNSGGGAVLQGPGCLNYALVLRMEGTCASIDGTNRFVLEQNARSLGRSAGENVERRGFTDLTIANLKFSGNAQRRRLRYLLFHGTFLLSFDLPKIARYLAFPSREPDYRNGRSHTDFVMNIRLSAAEVKSALKNAWGTGSALAGLPLERTRRLVAERYGRDEWNYRM
jgi:lipoate-protein ligase A